MNKTELERTIKEIQAYHDVGRAYLKQGRLYGSPGTALEKDHRAKARVFANPESGFTQQELNALFNAFRRENWAMSLCFVRRLISVGDKKEREQIQAEAIRQHWSIRVLDKQIRERYGNRRPLAGRHRTIAGSADARDELLRAADRWQRLHRAVAAAAGAPVNGFKITPALQRRLSAVDAAMAELQSFLEKDRPAQR